MRRVLRYVGNGLVLLSLLLCIASVGAWVRSYWAYDHARVGSHVNVGIGRGELLVGSATTDEIPYPQAWTHFPHEAPDYWAKLKTRAWDMRWRFAGVAYFRATAASVHYRYVFVNLWWPMTVFAMLPTAWAVAVHKLSKAAQRRENELCVACGYDLQGNVSGICPECGKAIAS